MRGTPEVGKARVPVRREEAPEAPYRGTPRKPGEPTPRIKLPDGREVFLQKTQLEGSYFWKQGFVWKLWLPPFTKPPISIFEKPPYAKEVNGEGSAQKSLIEKGNAKSTPALPMGIVSIQVENPRNAKPRLVYRRIPTRQHVSHSAISSSRLR